MLGNYRLSGLYKNACAGDFHTNQLSHSRHIPYFSAGIFQIIIPFTSQATIGGWRCQSYTIDKIQSARSNNQLESLISGTFYS